VLHSLLDRADVARALGVSSKRLNFLLHVLSPTGRYRSFEIKKRAGGTRTIRAPILPLKQAQKQFAGVLAAWYQPRSCVFGYVANRNIQQNAECHRAKRWVLRVDLKDFFPSIHFGRVRGMFLAAPFSLPAPVATTLAQLVCHENQLPQGSPASPVLSNLICRGLDRALSKLARVHRCTYTRYCDDLIFSTNRRSFPIALADFDTNGPLRAIVGPALEKEITAAGFVVNPDKVSLRSSSQRQMVTGLVTNARVNVPRQYIRGLRAILHAWHRHGLDAAASWYFENHDKRSRPPGKLLPSFQQIVRGKVQYLGSVRGWRDPTYVGLGKKLSALDSSFRITKGDPSSRVGNVPLHLFVEGRTDKRHYEMALAMMKASGRFRDLQVEIDGKDRGSAELLKVCKTLAERVQTPPCVFVFDSDEPNVVTQVTDSNGDLKDWGNSVYSFVIASPHHRPDNKGSCVELLYADDDLRRMDDDGRRLFLRSEFRRASGRHATLDAYSTTLSRNSLIVEDGVFNFDEKNLCLSKTGFANVIQKAGASVSFEGFAPVFQQLVNLRNRILETR
jgi:RNA-directed DNA polymerase